MRRTLVLGATSAIAQAAVRLLALDGDRFFLVARDAAKLRAVTDELTAKGNAPVGTLAADLNDLERHPGVLEEALRALGGLDLLFICHGVLGKPEDYEANYPAADAVIRTNFLSIVSFLTHAVPHFEKQRSGMIAVVTSVAGDRGRRGNYVYSASKAGIDVYLQGLRCRLHAAGVSVLTIKPGWVETPMTSHIPKTALFSSPETVAKGIHRAIRGRKDVVYLPFYWKLVMGLVRALPEGLFKKIGRS